MPTGAMNHVVGDAVGLAGHDLDGGAASRVAHQGTSVMVLPVKRLRLPLRTRPAFPVKMFWVMVFSSPLSRMPACGLLVIRLGSTRPALDLSRCTPASRFLDTVGRLSVFHVPPARSMPKEKSVIAPPR